MLFLKRTKALLYILYENNKDNNKAFNYVYQLEN
jgi:hypothetical protein